MISAVIDAMLEKYRRQTQSDYERAIHEIIQEIALLGLWRSKFFEQAAFYGGTALRVLYGLNRFSEDLDFSLLSTNEDFDLSRYNRAIKMELNSYGFDVEVESRVKLNRDSAIQSAFIKANTKQQMLNIHVPDKMIQRIHRGKKISIKMEVDTDPPLAFETETRLLLEPIPFSVHTFNLPCLFSGKLHALLCRTWKKRVKGRDWYDFVWYLGRNIKPDYTHLKERLVQTGHWSLDKRFNVESLRNMLLEHIETIDFDQAKEDVVPFLEDPESISLWSQSFFTMLVQRYFKT